MLAGARTPTGALRVTSSLPTPWAVFMGGIIVEPDGTLPVSLEAPTFFANGFGTTIDGRLCVALDGAISAHQQGLPFTSGGRLVVTSEVTPVASDSYVGGTRVKSSGGVFALGAANTFSPSELFSNGERGMYYDPTLLDSLLQSSTGSPAVSASGQPTGLIVDQSETSTHNSTLPVMVCDATITQAGNVLTFASTPSGAGARGNPPINPAYFYRISFTVAGTGSVQVSIGAVTRVFSSGTYVLEPFNASGTTVFIIRAHTTGFSGTFTFSELVEFPGNNAVQATSAARPTYQVSSGLKSIKFDEIDDVLVTQFSPDLGAVCTVGVALPTGAELTVQAIGSSFSQNRTMFALVAVNRLLTSLETYELTGWLNNRAGV